MNTIAILEIISLLANLYYKHAEMEGLSEEEVDARLATALSEKARRDAGKLPGA